MIQTLLNLTKYGLKNETYPFSIDNEKEFLKLAYESGLIGIIFESVDSSKVSASFYQALQSLFYNFIGKDNAQLALIDKIDKLFNDHEIKHTFLKGAHLKQLYPKSYFRGMGDIDCLVDKKDIKKIGKLFKENGFKVSSKSEEHDVYSFKGNMVEIHRTISHSLNKKTEAFFKNPEAYLIPIKDYKYRLDYTYEGVYLLHHLSKHILSSGIGLRSLLDISIFFKHYEKEIDLNKLTDYLLSSGLDKFFEIVLYFNQVSFDITSPFLDKDFKLNEQAYTNLLNYLITSGIHGKGVDFNAMAPRTVHESKVKVLLRVLLPNWSNMKMMYPWLKYIPILLPIAYLLRWFKLVFLRTKNSFRKLSKLSKSKQDKEELKKLFNALGL